MTFDRWASIKEVLAEALERPPEERGEFLRSCSLDHSSLSEVESLLNIENEADDFMSTTAGGLAGEFFDEDTVPVAEMSGRTIGPYQIESELGVGGMGAVFVARRCDGKFDQRVAIKLVRREFNVARVREAFDREIGIQSALIHPNIARILDTGTTEDGIPYIAMEFVDGEPLDEYCRKRSLTLRERLKVFNKVCEAVSFAHRNLTVHRDIKPTNILVSPDGTPKLLDFGLSKLLGSIDDAPASTLFGAMTPEYASPEQARGETVTTATDIYSLGVVLYKLLTGRLPYSLTSKAPAQLAGEISVASPAHPSRSVSEDGPIRRSELAGDLDNIILKALSKEPSDRYQTVDQLSDDIWRWMDGMPVSARAASWQYRAGRFFKRNRIVSVSAALVLLAIVGGAGTAIWQSNTARVHAAVAESEADKARAEQAKAEKVTRFMSKIIGYANPAWYAEGSKLKGQARVIDALDDLEDKIDVEFATEPDVAAELHHKFSEVFLMVSRGQPAAIRDQYLEKRRIHILRALELRVRHYGEWHELVAKDLYYGFSLIGKTEREQADLLMRAIVMMRDTNPKNLNLPYMFETYAEYIAMPATRPERAQAYLDAVLPPTDKNRYEIAEEMLRESLPIFRLHYNTDNGAIHSAECRLTYALAMQGKWSDLDKRYAICKRFGEDDPSPDALKVRQMYVDLIESALAGKARP